MFHSLPKSLRIIKTLLSLLYIKQKREVLNGIVTITKDLCRMPSTHGIESFFQGDNGEELKTITKVMCGESPEHCIRKQRVTMCMICTAK